MAKLSKEHKLELARAKLELTRVSDMESEVSQPLTAEIARLKAEVTNLQQTHQQDILRLQREYEVKTEHSSGKNRTESTRQEFLSRCLK